MNGQGKATRELLWLSQWRNWLLRAKIPLQKGSNWRMNGLTIFGCTFTLPHIFFFQVILNSLWALQWMARDQGNCVDKFDSIRQMESTKQKMSFKVLADGNAFFFTCVVVSSYILRSSRYYSFCGIASYMFSKFIWSFSFRQYDLILHAF